MFSSLDLRKIKTGQQSPDPAGKKTAPAESITSLSLRKKPY
jgi:hypothetical protein